MADMPIELYGLDVSTGARLLLAYLWRHAGRERFVWPGRSTIATDLRISDRTLRRYLGELRDAHVITENTEVRRGWFRSGWWLSDAAASCNASPGVDYGEEPCASLDTEAGTSPRGQNWPPRRHERPTSSANAARTGRLSSIEPPMNQDSLSASSALEHTGRRHDEAERGEEPDLDQLRRWRVDGGDPEGLGPWPQPQLANGVRLPRLAMSQGVRDRLAEGRSPEELHRAAHLMAELVEAGALAPDKWRATYVFSGWLDQLVIQALEHRARQQQRPPTTAEPAPVTPPQGCSLAFMQSAMETSEALRPLARQLRAPPPARVRSEPRLTPSEHTELLDLRGQVQAIAEALGCAPAVVLQELGRSSMREVQLADKAKLGRVFVTIREGPRPPPTAPPPRPPLARPLLAHVAGGASP